MEWLSGLNQRDEGVEKLHAGLSKTLAEQPRRFFIIDDIDRLSPDGRIQQREGKLIPR